MEEDAADEDDAGLFTYVMPEEVAAAPEEASHVVTSPAVAPSTQEPQPVVAHPSGTKSGSHRKGRGGNEGNEGNEGDEGDEGNEGNEGDEGNEGNEGDEGDEGNEGNEGDEGNEGNEGDEGEEGNEGNEGKKSHTGKMGHIFEDGFAVAPVVAYPAVHPAQAAHDAMHAPAPA
jgi:hypothetical protein